MSKKTYVHYDSYTFPLAPIGFHGPALQAFFYIYDQRMWYAQVYSAPHGWPELVAVWTVDRWINRGQHYGGLTSDHWRILGRRYRYFALSIHHRVNVDPTVEPSF